MTFPMLHRVTRVRRTVGEEVDELGNDIVKEDATELPVFGWYYASPDEPVVAGHPRIEVDVFLIAGVGDFVATDAVVLPGDPDAFEVIGPGQNYDNNPWWSPHREVVTLKRSQR